MRPTRVEGQKGSSFVRNCLDSVNTNICYYFSINSVLSDIYTLIALFHLQMAVFCGVEDGQFSILKLPISLPFSPMKLPVQIRRIPRMGNHGQKRVMKRAILKSTIALLFRALKLAVN